MKYTIVNTQELIAALNSQPTTEQLDFFYVRTRNHIDLVKKYIVKIYNFLYNPLLLDRRVSHDQSKYLEPELTPYVFTTWVYHCKNVNIPFEVSESLKTQMREATYHHVKNNRHHPEFHDSETTIECINSKDRDKPPEKMVSGYNMSNIDIAEMVADWCAMSEELNSSPYDWAKANINVRWKFTPKQEKLIYSILDKVW